MCYSHQHVFDRYISWFIVMDRLIKGLESLERWYMYVFRYKALCLAQHGNIIGIFIYALTVMCLWQYDGGDFIVDIAMKS